MLERKRVITSALNYDADCLEINNDRGNETFAPSAWIITFNDMTNIIWKTKKKYPPVSNIEIGEKQQLTK